MLYHFVFLLPVNNSNKLVFGCLSQVVKFSPYPPTPQPNHPTKKKKKTKNHPAEEKKQVMLFGGLI